MSVKIFVDSDVIISSLISSTGAAHFLLNKIEDIKPFISNYSVKELERVIDRLNLKKETLASLIQEKFHLATITKSSPAIKRTYKNYVLDINDAHIIAGAEMTKVKFLITYNIKHFQ